MESIKTADEHPRRGFLPRLLTVVLGALAGVAPVGAGLATFLDPLRRRRGAAPGFIRVASLEALPEDGVPRKFAVIAAHTDAWNKFPAAPIGAVYLRRMGSASVQAFNVVCPHAGCFVEFVAARKGYLCPCHNSTFSLEGRVNDPKSPSPRGLDELAVEIRNGGEVWVRFQNFRAGTAQRTPLS
jgi:menaquinol-cytochrome c reductase iron-sulfur subunit